MTLLQSTHSAVTEHAILISRISISILHIIKKNEKNGFLHISCCVAESMRTFGAGKALVCNGRVYGDRGST